MSESLNRGFNLLATALVAVSCFTFTPRLFFAAIYRESLYYNLDNILLLMLGAAVLWWYLRHTNRFKRSMLPVEFAAIGLGTKVLGLIINFDRMESPTNTLGGLVLFFLVTAVVVQQYFKTQQLIESFNF